MVFDEAQVEIYVKANMKHREEPKSGYAVP
jgi:hypothetical protein